MISKTFAFSKIQKTTDNIEKSLNDFLKEHEFKYATQNESSLKGKFIITLFGEEGKSTLKVKAFKGQDFVDLDKKVNAFLSKVKMKFVTQTFVGSSVYTIVFYDKAKSSKDEDQTTNNQDGTSGTN
jgi:hypothetical protein